MVKMITDVIAKVLGNKPQTGTRTITGQDCVYGENVTLGHWSKIGNNVSIGNNVTLGPWTTIGDNAVIGDDVVFGHWAQIGRDVVIGKNVVLGSHTHVKDGTHVPDGATFDDTDLVTAEGVIPNRCSGSVRGRGDGVITVAHVSGHYAIPVTAFEDEHPDDGAKQMLEDYEFGRSERLTTFRLPPDSGPEMIPEL